MCSCGSIKTERIDVRDLLISKYFCICRGGVCFFFFRKEEYLKVGNAFNSKDDWIHQ